MTEIPEGMTSDKLRMMADWFDTYDRLAETFINNVEQAGWETTEDLAEVRLTVDSDAVQDELRRWADAIDDANGRPKTFEEAVARQRLVHAAVDAGDYATYGYDWRNASLKAGYEMRTVLDYGLGQFPVNVITEEVCEWNGKWSDDGAVLLCQDCFLDGT